MKSRQGKIKSPLCRIHLSVPANKIVPQLFSSLITVRNEVGARLCFHRRVRFCSQGVGWGCLPQCMLGYHLPHGADPPGADTPLGVDTPPGADTPPRHSAGWEIRSTCGRYASYKNAILFIYSFCWRRLTPGSRDAIQSSFRWLKLIRIWQIRQT